MLSKASSCMKPIGNKKYNNKHKELMLYHHLGMSGGIRLSSTAKVWIDKNTKLICQGFTGKQGMFYKFSLLSDMD